MDILEQFNRYLFDNKLVNQCDKVLCAVSGGKDSMLMLSLFIQAGFSVEIAHCNFNLRGEESDGDEDLVRKYAATHNIPLHIKHFDTKQYAQQHKVSIQVAARELRYAWFEELRLLHKCVVIAIAQHKNDHVETVLLNLTRGTGIRGLGGIQKIRDYLIRPLLFLEARDISQLVSKLSIPFRDDSSNFSNKYARNKIRLDIIPEFEKLNPEFIAVMDENISRFQESITVLDDFVCELRNDIFIPTKEDTWEIDKSIIANKKIALLYLLFEPFHFTKPVLEDMYASLNGESGRIFESDEFILLSDRSTLVLKRKLTANASVVIDDISTNKYHWGSHQLEISSSEDCSIEALANVAQLDMEKIIFPIMIRSWQEGDFFQPLGMNGRKKLSDFFIQRKVNVLAKAQTPILVNGNGDIMWIVGFQLDDRYKITQMTKKVLKLVFH